MGPRPEAGAREAAWLTWAARRFVAGDASGGADTPPAGAWPRLEAAESEGLTGVLACALERWAAAGERVPPLAPWRAAVRRIAASNLSALAELRALCGALGGERVIVLKGAALAHGVYRQHVGLRPLGDVDILLRPDDVAAAAGWLTNRGYAPVVPDSPCLARGAVTFDLHAELVGSSWVGRKADAFRLDSATLWRDAVDRGRPDGALELSPVHQVLHLAVHGLKHSYSRLIWLVDLALLLRGVPAGALVESARATGALRPLAYAAALLDGMLGVRVPAALARALPALNAAERGFVVMVTRRPRVETPGELLVAFSIPGVIGKLAYLAELGFPGRAALARHHPHTPRWLLYPRRAVRLAALGVREGVRLGRSRR